MLAGGVTELAGVLGITSKIASYGERERANNTKYFWQHMMPHIIYLSIKKLLHLYELFTFSIDITMTPCKSPVKVVRANSLDITVTRPVKQHPLINVYNTFYLSQLGLFPLIKKTIIINNNKHLVLCLLGTIMGVFS